MSGFHIREARLPEDRVSMLGFIDALQAFELEFEKDRRVDATVAAEYLAVMLSDVAKGNGKIFIADGEDGARLGWSAAHEREGPVFVVESLRLEGYLTELYVTEAARGLGVGRALIAACEDWARSRKLPALKIGAIAGNARALRIYEEAGFRPYAIELRKLF
jgi:GNAT superfamily N-acetyltransferase